MFRNYLITAFRNFRNYRSYTLINIIGLSIGIACCLVVFTIMKHELTFDSFHEKSDKIYRVVERYDGEYGVEFDGVVPNAMPQAILENSSNVEAVITAYGPFEGLFSINHNKRISQFKEQGTLFVNSEFLKYLDFKIVAGASAELLDQPYKCFLTQRTAEKFFGSDNPIGKFIKYNEHTDLEVVGILKNTPTNTSLPFNILVSSKTVLITNANYLSSWDAYWQSTIYVAAESNDNLKNIEEEITSIAHANMTDRAQKRKSYYLQPITEIHTDTKYGDGVNYVAPTEVLIGFLILALVTLTASILNFTNLATAQASKRSKEIGIRKTLGSDRYRIMFQFLSETFMLVLISTLLAFTIGQFFITKMNEYLTIVMFNISYDSTTVLFAFGLSIFITILGSFYPAKLLAGYNPINAIRNQITLSSGSGNLNLRRSLIILQFIIANMLIVSTIIVAAQMNHIRTKDLGFETENIIEVEIPWANQKDLKTLQTEFTSLSSVEKVSVMYGTPQSLYNWNSNYEVLGEEVNEKLSTNIKFIDKEYLDLFEIPLVAGRNITEQYTSDTTINVLVSREFLKRVNLSPEEGVGRKIKSLGNWEGKINGVVEDFNNWSLQSKLGPVLMIYKPSQFKNLAVKIKSETDVPSTMMQIEEVFRNFSSDGFYEAKLITQNIRENYIIEDLVYTTFQIFAGLSILIGIFGLYGLVSFLAASRRKAISIRKVFGANIRDILKLFFVEFMILMVIAFALSAPLGYLLADEWLNGFQYRINITPIFFVASFIVLNLIVIGTAGYRSFRAATSNPVDSLRYE